MSLVLRHWPRSRAVSARAAQDRAAASSSAVIPCFFFQWSLARSQSAASDSRAGAPVVVESVLIVAQVASRGAGGLGGGLCWGGEKI